MDFNAINSIFSLLTSANPDDINKATQSILELQQNPQFIIFCFNSLSDQLLQTNPTLYTHLQITILNNIRQKWQAVFTPGNEYLFWTPEQQQQIVELLLQNVFNIPNEHRSHFIIALQTIIQSYFKDECQALNVGIAIIHRLAEVFAPKSQSIIDVNTFLQVIAEWSRSSYKRTEFFKKSEFLLIVEQVDTELLKNVFNIIPFAFQNVSQSVDACVISVNSIKILRYSLYHLSDFLADPSFQNIFQQISQIILLNSADDSVLKVKIQIYKLIDILNSTFLPAKLRIKSDIRKMFAATYKQQIVPFIIENTIQLTNLPSNYELKIWTMDVFYQFLKYQAYDTSIFTPEFILNILLKYARIELQDTSEPIINPEQFLTQQFQTDLTEKANSPRTFCYLIMQTAILNLNIHEQLYPLFFSSPSDKYDFEARMFLFLSYIKAVMKLEKKSRKGISKKKARSLPPILPHVQPGDFQKIIDVLKSENDPSILITLIYLCAVVLKYTNPESGIELAEQIILTSNLPILKCAASKMFNNCESHLEELPEGLNPVPLIQNIIEAVGIFSDNNPSDMINKLCSHKTENLAAFGCNIIGILFDEAIGHFDNDYNANCGDNILDNVYNIISAYDDNDPALVPILELCSTKIVDILGNCPEFESSEKLYDILAILNQKLFSNYPIQLQTLTFLIKHWESNFDCLIYPRQVCQIIYPLITGQNRLLSNYPEIAQAIVCLNISMLQKMHDENTESEDLIGYSLFLASCIVQVFGDVNDTFLQVAFTSFTPETINGLKNDPLQVVVFVQSLSIIAAYFVVSPQKVISGFNPELISIITQHITKRNFLTYRELVVALIILLNFTKMGFSPAYLRAAKLIPTLIKYRRLEVKNENNEEEEEEEEENEEEENEDDECIMLLTPFKVPFDSYDIITLFKEVSDQTGLFQGLPPELQQKIMGYLQ